jgi:aminoglycoside 2'-N-acetyltransferase I
MPDAVVTVRPTEELSSGDRSAVIDLCNAANDTEAFWQLFGFVPSGGLHVLVHCDGELVSHAAATTRWVQPGVHPVLRTAYVDAVATRPEHQGRSYSSMALRRLAAAIVDADIGCLQTDIAPFYERLGWEVWRGPLAGRGRAGVIPTPQQTGVMILRLPTTPALDLDTQLTIEVQPSRIWE